MDIAETARWTDAKLSDGRDLFYYDPADVPERRPADDDRRLNAPSSQVEMRTDPLTDDVIAYATHRNARTHMPPANECPLCPTRPGHATEIPDADYEVAVFENRFPSFAGTGRCDVVCFTGDHDVSFTDLSVGQARLVVDAWADRTAAPFLPPRMTRLLERARQHQAVAGSNLFADILADERKDGSRIVGENDALTAFVPAAARWPLEVHLYPNRQVADISELTPDERSEFCVLYLDVLRRMDGPDGDRVPYIAAWHAAPVRTDRDLGYLHLELLSIRRAKDKLKYLAGSESAMGSLISDTRPEDVAAMLRKSGA